MAEWLARIWLRRSVSTVSESGSFTDTVPESTFALWTINPPTGFWVSLTASRTPPLCIEPVSPTCPPDSP